MEKDIKEIKDRVLPDKAEGHWRENYPRTEKPQNETNNTTEKERGQDGC